MQPLKVTAELVGPIAGDVPKLDALVEMASAHRCDPSAMKPTDEHGDFVPDGVPIPISRRRVNGFAYSVPLCSWPIFISRDDRRDHVNKRFDPDPTILNDKSRGVFAANSGELRSYRLPLRVRDVSRVVWFCVGQGATLRQLLSHERSGMRYLGKKGSIGYGQIARWIVEPMADDWSWFAPSPAGEVLMRALPASAKMPNALIGFRKWFGGVVAPYWSAKYHVEMVEPC